MHKPRLGLWIMGVVFFLIHSQPGQADIDAPKVDSTKKAHITAPLSDKKILTHLYWENLRETEMDRLAQVQGTSDTTQGLAEDLMKDHVFFAREVRALAGRLGIRLRTPPDPQSAEGQLMIRHNAQLAKLKTLTGAAFDRRYKSIMLKNHADTIHFIKKQQVLLPKDSPVYSLLGTLLPKVEDHYEVIESTDDTDH